MSVVARRNEHTTGYQNLDTLESFNADSMVYTKWFNMSGLSYMRVDMYCRDTSTAGFADDSINFKWGVQTGHLTLNADGDRDTLANKALLLCDSMNMYSATFLDQEYDIIAGSAYDQIGNIVDTLSVSGFCSQSHNPSPEYDVYIRGWAKGGTGNETVSFLDLRFLIIQRTKD